MRRFSLPAIVLMAVICGCSKPSPPVTQVVQSPSTDEKPATAAEENKIDLTQNMTHTAGMANQDADGMQEVRATNDVGRTSPPPLTINPNTVQADRIIADCIAELRKNLRAMEVKQRITQTELRAAKSKAEQATHEKEKALKLVDETDGKLKGIDERIDQLEQRRWTIIYVTGLITLVIGLGAGFIFGRWVPRKTAKG